MASSSLDQSIVDGSNLNAAMDSDVCLVCHFVVTENIMCIDGCGHCLHNECFAPFLQMQEFTCDSCANAQYLYNNGYVEELYNGTDFDVSNSAHSQIGLDFDAQYLTFIELR